MKKTVVFIGSLFILFSTIEVNAQTKTGLDFFRGKWNMVFSGTPAGDIKMTVIIEGQDNEIKGFIADDSGNELYKVTRTEIQDEVATISFIGSQGMDVPLTLIKKEEDHVDAEIMRMFYSVGERGK